MPELAPLAQDEERVKRVSGMKNCTHHSGLSDVSRVEREAWVVGWCLSIAVEVAFMLSIRVHGTTLKPTRGKVRLLKGAIRTYLMAGISLCRHESTT